MTTPSLNKDKQVKAPDMGRFGFYIKPLVYRREHGFNEARALLLLDANGMIERSDAKKCGLTALLVSQSSTLFSINPVYGKYPSASQLLQKLKLGRIAQQKTTTIRQIDEQFYKACQQSGIDFDALEMKSKLGVNADGLEVYEMLNGRYIVDESGMPTREAEPKKLLYAIGEDGEIDEDALRECVETYFSLNENNKDEIINAKALKTFTDAILQRPPVKLEVETGNFTPISFIEKQDIRSEHFKQFYQMLSIFDAEQLQKATNAKSLLAFFQSVYRRKLCNHRAYQHDLPAPIVAALGQILFHDGKKKLYSPVVGSSFMLSLFLGRKKTDSELELNLCEPFLDTRDSLESFIEKTRSLYDDSDFDPSSVYIESEIAPVQHDICLTFTSNEDTHIGAKIPHTNYKTHSKSHQTILQSLECREDSGRSIFISAVDNSNKLGEVHESSFKLISYLYQQYANVMIFDIDKALLNPSLFNYPVRVYIVGSRTKFGENFEYENFVSDGDLPVVSKPNAFFAACQEYIQQVENEAMSTIDLMSVYEIDSAIAEADEAYEQEDISSDVDVEHDAPEPNKETHEEEPHSEDESSDSEDMAGESDDTSTEETEGGSEGEDDAENEHDDSDSEEKAEEESTEEEGDSESKESTNSTQPDDDVESNNDDSSQEASENDEEGSSEEQDDDEGDDYSEYDDYGDYDSSDDDDPLPSSEDLGIADNEYDEDEEPINLSDY